MYHDFLAGGAEDQHTLQENDPAKNSSRSEVATERAAAACDTIMLFKRRDISAMLVERTERSGHKAIVLTVDAPRLGRREAAIKNK
ncbi:hypothetical protein SLEP1_g21224 [Rubroshorea leprosula]|uniref:FMN-dependent dehydrogenase domain-containing protein n=1 Tax=Rubroshorea leprosula TaxID=152421 RepID=A0AAV5J598_9ROSI|nr:hypothetical protein SLEP1_g21224 [Rubroshorea leprosula]